MRHCIKFLHLSNFVMFFFVFVRYLWTFPEAKTHNCFSVKDMKYFINRLPDIFGNNLTLTNQCYISMSMNGSIRRFRQRFVLSVQRDDIGSKCFVCPSKHLNDIRTKPFLHFRVFFFFSPFKYRYKTNK